MARTIGSHALAAASVRTFIEGGAATFTVRNTRTEGRYTYRVKRPKGEKKGAALFVSVLNGPNNEKDYAYIGFITDAGEFVPGKGPIPRTAVSVRGFAWVWSHVDRLAEFPNVEVHHIGACGRCGRPLTVPESITTGLGPVCAQRV